MGVSLEGDGDDMVEGVNSEALVTNTCKQFCGAAGCGARPSHSPSSFSGLLVVGGRRMGGLLEV